MTTTRRHWLLQDGTTGHPLPPEALCSSHQIIGFMAPETGLFPAPVRAFTQVAGTPYLLLPTGEACRVNKLGNGQLEYSPDYVAHTHALDKGGQVGDVAFALSAQQVVMGRPWQVRKTLKSLDCHKLPPVQAWLKAQGEQALLRRAYAKGGLDGLIQAQQWLADRQAKHSQKAAVILPAIGRRPRTAELAA